MDMSEKIILKGGKIIHDGVAEMADVAVVDGRIERIEANIEPAEGDRVYDCEGKVVMSDYSKSYGYYIIIDHGGGVSTLYAHLSKLKVKYGETVESGQNIGVSGNSGWSNGPHLHLEIRIDGKPCDPLTVRDKNGKLYLSRPSNLYSAYPNEFEVPKITD